MKCEQPCSMIWTRVAMSISMSRDRERDKRIKRNRSVMHTCFFFSFCDNAVSSCVVEKEYWLLFFLMAKSVLQLKYKTKKNCSMRYTHIYIYFPLSSHSISPKNLPRAWDDKEVSIINLTIYTHNKKGLWFY